MALRDRLLLRLRSLRADQRGIAVPTALMALVASFALASVAVMSTVNVQRGSNRDLNAKEAIAAADAGANVALLRLNRFLPSLSTASPCIGPSGEAQTVSEGWCPQSPTEKVGGGSYSYRVSAFGPSQEIAVVSTGTSGTVSRRVSVGLKSLGGKNPFAEENVIGQEEITLEGSATIETSIGTNGNIIQKGGAAVICGNDRHGVGKEAPTPQCEGETSEGNKNLPPVTPPENIATENSDCRLELNCASGEQDTYSKKFSTKTPWEKSTQKINVESQATLTMGGRDYWVCGLFINGGKIFMAAETAVRIFVRTPEECGLAPGAVQVEIKGNSNIEATGGHATTGYFSVPGIYMLGNGAVNLAGNTGTSELMLYAPESEVTISGTSTWDGLFAGKSLKINGTPLIKSDPNIKKPELHLASVFERTRYVECTGTSASPPNASC